MVKHIFLAFHGRTFMMDPANFSILTDFPTFSFLRSHDFFYLLVFFALLGWPFHFSLPVLPDPGSSLCSYNRTFYKWNTVFILLCKIQIKLARPLYPTSSGKSSALSNIYENTCRPINYGYPLIWFPATAELDNSFSQQLYLFHFLFPR